MDRILKSATVVKQAVGEAELALINAQTLRPLAADEVFTPSATRRGTPSPSLRRLTAWSCGPSPPWTGRRTASN